MSDCAGSASARPPASPAGGGVQPAMASSPGESARQSARISIAAIMVPVVLTPRVISVGMMFNAEAGCRGWSTSPSGK